MELATLAGVFARAELRGECRVRFEAVAVGVHVHLCAETGVRRRAVVALEEVLDDDLPVRVRSELDAGVELDRVHVELAREDRGQLAEVIGERLGTGSGLTKRNGPHVPTLAGSSDNSSLSKPGSRPSAAPSAACRRARTSTRGSGTGASRVHRSRR